MRSKSKRLYWIISGIIALAVVAALLFIGGRSRQAQASTNGGEIVTAFIGNLAAQTSASGKVVAQREARLTMGISGQVAQVQVAVGETVKAGDVLLQLETAALERAVASAEQSLIIQQANLDSLFVGATEADIAAAEASLASAQAQLDDLRAGPSEAEIASAEAQLAQAEANLAALLAGATDTQIIVAEAQVNQARISLEETRENLAKTTLTAPFDGVVTAVHVAEGEMASGLVIELVDINRLEVVLNVDEIDIGSLEIGQPAMITLEAWPDVAIESEIALIAPQASSSVESAVVTYAVHLSLQSNLPIRIGMTANASLITAEREDVLLLPNAAINADRANGTYSINLVTTDAAGNQVIEEVTVTIGLRDSRYTQITSGLQAGDEVAIGNILPVQQFGPGNGGGPFGGN